MTSGSAYAQVEKQTEGKTSAQSQTGPLKGQGQGNTKIEAQKPSGSGSAQSDSTPESRSQTGPLKGQGQGNAKIDASGEKPAQLSEQQRTQIGASISKQSNLKRVERNMINFTINVGSVVPRTVGLVPLPATLVAVVPAYRGYLYIVVGNELLIVHPRTYEIVAVIPA
jgi:hypothetical protein